MGQKQEAAKTPVTIQQMFDALVGAHARYFNSLPSVDTVLLLVAHWHFETGGGAGMWNYNVGNFKGTPGDPDRDWCFFRCNELVANKTQNPAWANDPRVQVIDKGTTLEVWFSPDHPACCFRAFSSLSLGVYDYLTGIVQRFSDGSRGPTDAWHAAVTGDVTAFCHALKLRGYYTDGEAHYTASVIARLQQVKNANPDTVSIFNQVQLAPANAGGRVLHEDATGAPEAVPEPSA